MNAIEMSFIFGKSRKIFNMEIFQILRELYRNKQIWNRAEKKVKSRDFCIEMEEFQFLSVFFYNQNEQI